METLDEILSAIQGLSEGSPFFHWLRGGRASDGTEGEHGRTLEAVVPPNVPEGLYYTYRSAMGTTELHHKEGWDGLSTQADALQGGSLARSGVGGGRVGGGYGMLPVGALGGKRGQMAITLVHSLSPMAERAIEKGIAYAVPITTCWVYRYAKVVSPSGRVDWLVVYRTLREGVGEPYGTPLSNSGAYDDPVEYGAGGRGVIREKSAILWDDLDNPRLQPLLPRFDARRGTLHHNETHHTSVLGNAYTGGKEGYFFVGDPQLNKEVCEELREAAQRHPNSGDRDPWVFGHRRTGADAARHRRVGSAPHLHNAISWEGACTYTARGEEACGVHILGDAEGALIVAIDLRKLEEMPEESSYTCYEGCSLSYTFPPDQLPPWAPRCPLCGNIIGTEENNGCR